MIDHVELRKYTNEIAKKIKDNCPRCYWTDPRYRPRCRQSDCHLITDTKPIWPAHIPPRNNMQRRKRARYVAQILIMQHKIKRNPAYLETILPWSLDYRDYDRLAEIALTAQTQSTT